MSVFRSAARIVKAGAALERADFSTREGAARFLIEFGELEAALVDRLYPEQDGHCAFTAQLRQVSRLAGRLFVTGGTRWAAELERAAAGLRLEGEVQVATPEGYAYYGLFPETYAQAAACFYERACPIEAAVCIGIRSIGASLSAVVGAALEERGAAVHSFTVRPREHPFERRLRISRELEERWRALAHAHFAVVDEGPGLSGSSFACVAETLSGLGVPDSRIALFPSWNPDGSEFVSGRARRQWARHEKYVAEFHPGAGFVDISAGRWRSLFYNDECDYPQIQPRHEARKYLKDGKLYKFAGLGSYGAPKLERARRLADAGFSPPVTGLDNGFLITEFVPGQPLAAGSREPELLAAMGRYAAFRAREFRAEDGKVAVDGRMLPHEWIATAAGYLKTDAVDHCDNHFEPGFTDIAWDIAGAIVEFKMDEAACRNFIHAYIAASGDRAIVRRLPEYRAAYCAFRREYCEISGLDGGKYRAAESEARRAS